MTSPATNPGTVASGAVYRCTACGREFAASSQELHWQPSGGACASILEPIGPVVVDTARDDRAGEPGAEALAQARREARR